MITMTNPFAKAIQTIPLAGRRITKSGTRYLLYLPLELNELWEELHKNKAKLNVIIIVPNAGDGS
jgi:hypothetical protein